MSFPGPRLSAPRAMRRVSRSLRLVLRLGPSATPGLVEIGSVPVPRPLVDFVAYAEDCLVTGRIALREERLTDLLNAHDEYALENVVVTGLADGREIDVPEVTIFRNDLLLAQAAEPRGNAGRRRRTRQHAVAAQVGPYLVRGILHTLPGTDPVASLGRRNVMVPLTNASIEFESGGEPQHRLVGTIIVNQERMDWVVEDVGELAARRAQQAYALEIAGGYGDDGDPPATA